MPNEQNERIKRKYFEYLREAKGNCDATVNAAANAIAEYERFSKSADFRTFNRKNAIAYKTHLRNFRNSRGEPLAKSTLFARCNRVGNFFTWLAGQAGYKSRITYSDAAYFNVTEKEARVAKATKKRPSPTLEQLLAAFHAMPTSSDLALRDRAIVALIALTGVRDKALTLLRMKHLRLGDNELDQDARSVDTKFSKTFSTWFLPVDGAFRDALVEWVELRTKVQLASMEDPLFPATMTALGPDGVFQASGLSNQHWSDAGPVREIFKKAFARVGLPYFNPHAVRDTLVALGERVCRNAEELKAWSQNIGHEGMLTTLTSYGAVPPSRQRQLLLDIQERITNPVNADDLATELQNLLNKLGRR